MMYGKTGKRQEKMNCKYFIIIYIESKIPGTFVQNFTYQFQILEGHKILIS